MVEAFSMLTSAVERMAAGRIVWHFRERLAAAIAHRDRYV